MPHEALARTDHRPWPLPEQGWKWSQVWLDLLFAHWPIASSTVAKYLPPELEVDEFDGTTWIGVVPFRMEKVAFRPLPPVPWLRAFPELNVRVYVRHRDRPGVWFFSLDAGNPVAVWAARRFFHLPYFPAQMECRADGERVRYSSQRRTGKHPRFVAEYGPVGSPFEAKEGTLEHWLTERYCLYTTDPGGRLYRGDIHHGPWPLQPAEARIELNELFPSGLEPADEAPPLLHFARRLDVVGWFLEKMPAGGSHVHAAG